MKIIKVVLLLFITFTSFDIFASLSNPIDFDTLIKTKNCEIKIHYSFDKDSTSFGSSKYVQVCFKPSDEVLAEAESKSIYEDKIYIKMSFDENCELKSIQVKKKGQLDKLNAQTEQICIELFNEIKDAKISKYFKNKNNGKCENVISCLKFSF